MAFRGIEDEDLELIKKIAIKLKIKYPNSNSSNIYFKDIKKLMANLDEGAAIDVSELKDIYFRDKLVKLLKLLPLKLNKSRTCDLKFSKSKRASLNGHQQPSFEQIWQDIVTTVDTETAKQENSSKNEKQLTFDDQFNDMFGENVKTYQKIESKWNRAGGNNKEHEQNPQQKEIEN